MKYESIRDEKEHYEMQAFINASGDAVVTMNHLPSGDDGLNTFVFEGSSDIGWLITQLQQLAQDLMNSPGEET